MRKLMMLAAMLGLMLALAIPAFAQIEQGFEQEAESGDVTPEFSSTNEGDNSNVCAPALQFGNSGNLQNAQGIIQYASEGGPGESGASESFGPSLSTSCSQDVQQSSAASSK